MGNIGLFQGSAISAMLFIIYQDDMMEDYDALNREEIPIKQTEEPPPLTEVDQEVSNEIRREFEKQNKEEKRKFIEQLYLDRQIFTGRKNKTSRNSKDNLPRPYQKYKESPK